MPESAPHRLQTAHSPSNQPHAPSIPYGVQLWTLREDWQRDPVATLKRLSRMGYTGIELYGDLPMSAAELKTVLQSLGMRVAAAHVGDKVDVDLSERMQQARVLGHDHFVFSFSATPFTDDAFMLQLAEAARARAGELAAQGFRMSMHHHEWEFVSPERGLRFIEACPQLGLEFDLYWLATAGLDPVEMVQRYAKRLHLVHAKDGPARRDLPQTALGEGKVPIAASLAAAKAAAAPLEWVLVELDECATDVWEALEKSRAWLAATA